MPLQAFKCSLILLRYEIRSPPHLLLTTTFLSLVISTCIFHINTRPIQR